MDRYYSFSCVCYYDESLGRDFLRSFSRYCSKIAYIFHDKDDKTPHWHLLCTFSQNKSIESVKKLLFAKDGNDLKISTLVQPLRDKFSAFRYLTHKDDPDKYQYPDSEVICNDLKYFTGSSLRADNEEFLNDITSCYLSYRELAIKYGRDYIRNFKLYSDFASACLKQESSINSGINPKCSIFISYDQFLLDIQLSFHRILSDLFGELIANMKYPVGRLIKI